MGQRAGQERVAVLFRGDGQAAKSYGRDRARDAGREPEIIMAQFRGGVEWPKNAVANWSMGVEIGDVVRRRGYSRGA
jgi:hypothetical protein